MADTTGRRLILKDETTIEDGEAGYAGGFLWLMTAMILMKLRLSMKNYVKKWLTK